MLDNKITTFIEVARCGSMSLAGEKLNLTQPCVTQHIHSLEAKYGKLFEYKNKTLLLTEIGQKLQLFALGMVKAHQEFEQERLAVTFKEKLTFGATLSVGEYIMPNVIADLIKTKPNLEVEMMVNNTDILLNMLKNNKIDFAVIEGQFDKSLYDSLVISKEEFVAVASAQSHLVDREVELSELFNQRLIMREKGSGSRSVFEDIMAKNNYSIEAFSSKMILNNLIAILDLVGKNVGITFIYKCCIEGRKDVKALNIKDIRCRREFNIVWLKHSRLKAEKGLMSAVFDSCNKLHKLVR